MRALRFISNILIFVFLTILTQIGGIIYLISLLIRRFTDRFAEHIVLRSTIRFTTFLLLYFAATFLLVPITAAFFGRVPLPIKETNHLKPLNILSCILNRNYVKPELRSATFEVARTMNSKYPGTITNYLDAGFPFMDGFPLLPHLSHNDGKKLDLSFYYRDSKTNASTNESPSFIGYGVCEEPLSGELNTSDQCANRGYWQYSFLTKVVSQKHKTEFRFDAEKTKDLVTAYSLNDEIGKIFIEPHLKTRLKLNSEKIRFDGCQAVRHDDHIHVQLK